LDPILNDEGITNMRWLIGATAILLLVIGVVLLINRCDRLVAVPVTPTESPQTASIATPQPLGTGEAGQSSIGHRKPIERPVQQPGAPPEVTDEPPIGVDKDSPLAQPPSASGPLTELKRLYAQQSADSSARETEREIESFFGPQVMPKEHLRSITCHESVCKISVYWTQKNPLAYMALAMKVGLQQAHVIGYDPISEVDRDGKMPLDLYVLRTGHTLLEAR
jgi:hypothetical protein